MMPSGNWSWMDGTPLDFIDWAPNEPSNVSGSNCVALSSVDGFWRADNCFKTKPFICETKKSLYEHSTTTAKTTSTTATKYPIYANCPFPFLYFEPTHSCYGVGNYTGPMNWTQGEQYCQSYGGHLTSIHSHNELLFLGTNVYTAHNSFWTGAISNDGENSWQWADRSSWDFNPWSKGYPKLHVSACGVLWGPSIGHNLCSDIHQIICKKPFVG